jgi:DNA helicase-2/ATP-dependent DNA helicase PcrA
MRTEKIFGPPGTGKTRYLMERFEKKVKQMPPEKIGFFTFTRAARLEALERTGLTAEELPFLRTIHAICYRQLGITQGQIVKNKDLREFGKLIGVDLSGSTQTIWESEMSVFPPRATKDDLLLQLNHLGRHRKTTLKEAILDAPTDVSYHYAKYFTKAYRDWKTSEGLLDYTDLLSEYLLHGKPLPVDVLFVDEAQDLSRLQWDVIDRLSADSSQVYIAGDDDQAIFNWAGASPEALIARPADVTTFLDQSWRVPASVLRVANDVISRVQHRQEKPLKPRDEEGEVGEIPFLDESYLDHDTSVLFRNHHRGRILKEQLEELGHPFIGEGSILSEQGVSRALAGWDQIHKGEKVNSGTARALFKMTHEELRRSEVENLLRKDNQSFSQRDLFNRETKLEEWLDVLKLPNRNYLEKAAHFHGFSKLLSPTTKLMSIHQAKGREANTIILDLELARKTYDSWLQNPDDEHRVWYVAVTRAKQRLLTLVPESVSYYHL